MRHHRSSVIVPSLLAVLALPVLMAEDAAVPAPAAPTPEAALQAADAAGAERKTASDTKYVQARAAFQSARFIEARELVDEAIRLNPANNDAQILRDDVLAVLSVRSNRLAMAATWFRAMQDVKTQELAVRLQGLMENGERKIAAKDFAGAELDFDRVDIGLRSFPYKFDWGELPKQVEAKRAMARAKSRDAALDRQAQARDEASSEATRQAALQEEALTSTVDELMRRARGSMARKDYKRAEIDAWNAYELDRRRDDARDLYLKARQGGHDQFDSEYRDQRLERLARVHEEIHKSLIPQNELVVYPEDWHQRSLRKAQELGANKEETWMGELRSRLQQRVTCNFVDRDFTDVVQWLREQTGISFVIAPDVIAGGVKNVSLQVKDMRLEEAIKWICTITQINWALDKQAIYLSKTPIQGSVVLRMYDVTDLVSPIVDFPGKEPGFAALGQGAAGGAGGAVALFAAPAGGEAATGGMDINKLIEFIKKSVDPASWKDGVDIQARTTTLFVNQSPEAHSNLTSLLTHMRQSQNLQVKMDVRLLDVRKGFFEEIGVEFRDPVAGTTAGQAGAGLINGATVDGGQRIYTQEGSVAAPNGYQRLNTHVAYLGNLTQTLPGNNYQSSVNAGATATQRGLWLDASYHPFGFVGMDQVNAIFMAMEEETDAQIIQQPELTVFNGQRANCTFVKQYAYIQSYDIVTYAMDPRIAVLLYGDVLDVRPVVSSDRKYITLEMRPTSVDFLGSYIENLVAPRRLAGGGGGGGGGNQNGGLVTIGNYQLELPNIELRSLRSTVMLPDRGTLVLGGYTKALRQRTHTGVPFLSHIPFLGRLFSKNGVYDQNRRLFFMLSAEIYDQQEREGQH
jgi:type II secretory pathway component GspD/PulD (secretin)